MSSMGPAKPKLQHMVLNVRDIEASHKFYTEVLGFEQCAVIEQVDMRFYVGGGGNHHDFALVPVRDPSLSPEPAQWRMFPEQAGIVHIAMDYGNREAWLKQIEHMQEIGVEFLERGNHGMTHSVYIADPDGNGIECLYDLPREVWEDDVNAALNYYESLPTEGKEALHDNTDYKVFGKG